MKKTRWIVALLAVALVVGAVAVLAVGCGTTTTTDDNGGSTGSSTDVSTDDTTQVRPGISGVSADVESVSAEDTGQTYTGDDALVFSLGMPEAASMVQTFVNPWIEAVEAGSNGRVEITSYPGNSLVKEEMQLRALDNGTSDMLMFQIGWAPEVFPLMEFGDLPMLFPNTEVAIRTMWTLIDEYRPDELKDYHILALAAISPAEYGGYSPVKSVADFQGLALRSGSSAETDIIEALGATAFPAGTDYVGTQVQQKRFDGLFLSWSFHAGNTVFYLPHYTKCDMFVRFLVLAMTKENWESLPAEVQQSIANASGLENSVKYANDDAAYNYDNSSIPGLQDKNQDYLRVVEAAAENGGEIYELTDAERAEWQEAMKPVLEEWVAKYADILPTQEIWDRAQELIEEYSAGQ